MLIVFNLVNFSWTGCLRPLTMHTVHFYKTNQRCFSSRPAEEVRWMRLCSTAIKKNYTVNMFWELHCPQFWETTWVKSLRAVQHYEIVVPIFPFTWPDAVCCHCHAHWENHSGWQFHLLYSSSCGLCQNLSFVSVFIFFIIFWWNFKQIQHNKNKMNLWLNKLQVSCSVSVTEVMAWLHTQWCSWQILRPLRSKPNYFPHSLAAHRAQHRCAAERLLDVLSSSGNSFSEIQILLI